MKNGKFMAIVKIAEIVTTAACGIGTIIATLKAARINEEQMEELAERTASKVIEKETLIMLDDVNIGNDNLDEVIKDLVEGKNDVSRQTSNNI